MSRIHQCLDQIFHRERLVIWYDPSSEWRKEFESYPGEITRIEVKGNEFGTKVRLLSEEAANEKHLIYLPSERPADTENWLLDLLLQGHEFKADRASLAVQAVGLPYEFRSLAAEHVEFFKNAKQVESLKEALHASDDEPEIRLKMMAILTKTEPDIDAILLEFLKRSSMGEILDPVEELLGSAKLVEPFWKEISRIFGYLSDKPSIHDFAVTLFKGADVLDGSVKLNPHSRVFLQRWKDSQLHKVSFRRWANDLENQMGISDRLSSLVKAIDLGDADTFEAYDKYVLHSLCREFEAGKSAEDIRGVIQRRRSSIWYESYEHGYEAILYAVDLRELLQTIELSIDSLNTGIERYMATWWKVDRAYRKTRYHLRKLGQVNLMEKIEEWVEKTYVNNFLLPLADRWSDKVTSTESWGAASIPSQRNFFTKYAHPILEKGQTVFVIISDALRYEAGMEFAERMNSENRFVTESSAMLGCLPSYTQLGMAALLPGSELAIRAEEDRTVTIDGASTMGTKARNDILRKALNDRARALTAEEFLEMNSKTDGRSLMKENDLIYIYHNTIDKIGDAPATEARTVEAVEQTFDELTQIVKKVININGSNILLTADHGFLFQQDQIDDGDMIPYPEAAEWKSQNRRYAIGVGIQPSKRSKIFTAAQLGLSGNWECAFPLSIARYPLQGSGKRYVHGGISLQEVIVPVIKISKKRSDDTGRVDVDFINVPAKITTGHVTFSIYQEKQVTTKMLPRVLRAAIYSEDGTPLSEVKTLECNSKSEEARSREMQVMLTLSHAADRFNNQTVYLRLEETLPNTTQKVTYKSHPVRIQKPFTTDFDEF
jgi:uncharacterized protein (TIGR02687 family)